MNEWWIPLLEPDGLLLRDRALAAVDPDVLLTALRSGRLRRVQRGVYLPRRVESTPLRLARAAVVSSGIRGAVASHLSAAHVWEVPVPRERREQHVTVHRLQRRRDRRDLRFHTRSLGVGDVFVRQGVPVTAVPRTLADLAVELPRVEAVWALDDARRRGLCSAADVAAIVERWRGGQGCATAQQRLAESDGVAESILETAGRLVLLDRAVPLPVPQHELRGPDGTLVARLDGAYVEERVALEFDGEGIHGLPEAVFRDRWRQNGLPELQWSVLRFTWWDVFHDPDEVARRVERTLAARVA